MEHENLINPFNERGKINKVKNTAVWDLHKKAIGNPKSLKQSEKDQIFKEVNFNTFFNDSIPLLGVRFDFSLVLKAYWVKFSYGDINQFKAINKTSIRNEFKNEIVKIVEIKQ